MGKNDVSRKKRTSERNEKKSWELISILFIATFMLGSLPFLNIDLSTSEVAAESFFGMGSTMSLGSNTAGVERVEEEEEEKKKQQLMQ